jgi:hypothetical protein
MLRVRRTSIEPVFGQTKHVRGIDCFTRRGLQAAHAEWQSRDIQPAQAGLLH